MFRKEIGCGRITTYLHVTQLSELPGIEVR